MHQRWGIGDENIGDGRQIPDENERKARIPLA